MPRMSSLVGVDVIGASGNRLGSVSGVLFHPRDPRVIGLVVTRPRLAAVVARPPVYVPLGAFEFRAADVRLATKGLPSNARGEKELGVSWDDTVLWDTMPVRSTSGEGVGAIADVSFDSATGAVRTLRVSTGVLGDIAVGRLDVPGELAEGFDGDAVVIGAGYADLKKSGGAAKAAAKTASVAKEAGGRVAKQAYDTGMSAAIAVGKSFKSGTGRRMIDTFKELTRDDDENGAG